MKNIYVLLILLCGSVISVSAQRLDRGVSGPMKFMEIAHNFGKISQGKPVTHNFELKNEGNKPLIIENVEVSCGCTSPEWNPEPIASGATSTIKVGFNAAAEGPFKKSITVIYNGGQVRTLEISGEVYPAPATSAPLNPSLSLLKQ